jgi:hypothetical protein
VIFLDLMKMFLFLPMGNPLLADFFSSSLSKPKVFHGEMYGMDFGNGHQNRYIHHGNGSQLTSTEWWYWSWTTGILTGIFFGVLIPRNNSWVVHTRWCPIVS